MVEAAFVPLPASKLVEELTKLRAVTAKRAGDEATAAVIAAAYTEGLRQYPADIVLSVIRKRRQWWPTLAELQNEADQAMPVRRMLRQALESAAAGRVAGLIAKAAERPSGPRKLPDGWRERAGIKSVAEPVRSEPDADWKPYTTPARVSSSLANRVAEMVAEEGCG